MICRFQVCQQDVDTLSNNSFILIDSIQQEFKALKCITGNTNCFNDNGDERWTLAQEGSGMTERSD